MKYIFIPLPLSVAVSIVYLTFFLYFTFESSYGQEVAITEDNFVITESVTSINDAILKSFLIISQVIALGITFNHVIFKWYLNRKTNHIIHNSQNQSQNLYFNSNRITKRFIIIILASCISIGVFSTGIIVLQSYELANNLELDTYTAFTILYSTPVGNVWLLRIITSILAIASTIGVYMFVIRLPIYRNKGQNKSIDDALPNQIIFNKGFNLWREKTFLIITLGILSVNLFSNSMVSHSNSLPSFSSIAVSIDWLHFMAVGIWIGGLFYLSMVFIKIFKYQKSENESENRKNLSHISNTYQYQNRKIALNMITMIQFSYIVIVCICIIGITGLYLSFVHIQSFTGLFNTTYGQLLVLKIVLTVPLILIGRYNQNKIHKYLKLFSFLLSTDKKDKYIEDSKKGIDIKSRGLLQAKENQIATFYKSIKKSLIPELIIGTLVLVVASFLSVTSPPSLETPSDTNPVQLNNNDENIPLTENTRLFMYVTIALSAIIIVLAFVNYRKINKKIMTLQ